MSLYTHFANKEELLDLMYAEVALRLYADSGQPTWQAEVVSLCHQVRRVLLEHPNWTPLLSRPAPPMSVPLRERLLALMTRDELSPGEAFIAVSNAGLLALGFALVEISFRDAEGRSSLAARFDRLKEWGAQPTPGNDDPVTRAALSVTPRFNLSDNFEAAVNTFVAGLNATILRSR